MDFPIGGKPFTLTDDCRNTRAIFDILKRYSMTDIHLMDDVPEGDRVIEYHSLGQKGRRRQLGRILHDLVNEKSLDKSQIVILGGHSMEHTCIGSNNHIGNFTIVEGEDEDPGIVHYYTYMKFKGCEADAVILLDVDPNDERWAQQTALYTTISRARYLLYIIWVD